MRGSRRRPSTAGFTLIELMVVIVIIGILAIIATSSYMGAQNRARVSDIKASMHAVQLGMEHYAGDNSGQYPNGAWDTGFSWSSYVPSQPTNPFNPALTGLSVMDPDVQTDTGTSGSPMYTVALTYATAGTAGNMRYFVDTSNNSSYAIIGYDQNGSIIQDSAASGSINFVLHN